MAPKYKIFVVPVSEVVPPRLLDVQTKTSSSETSKPVRRSKSIDDNDNTSSDSSRLKTLAKVTNKKSSGAAATPNANKKRLTRNNDLLGQSSTETLLDLLKAHGGIKDCSDETVAHINGVCTKQIKKRISNNFYN